MNDKSLAHSLFNAFILGIIFSIGSCLVYIGVISFMPMMKAAISVITAPNVLSTLGSKIAVIGMLAGIGIYLMFSALLSYENENAITDIPKELPKFMMGSKSIVHLAISAVFIDFSYLYAAYAFEWNSTYYAGIIHLILGIFAYPLLMSLLLGQSFSTKLNNVKKLQERRLKFSSR